MQDPESYIYITVNDRISPPILFKEQEYEFKQARHSNDFSVVIVSIKPKNEELEKLIENYIKKNKNFSTEGFQRTIT